MMCGFLLKNLDQDTESPASIFVDLFWMFVVDSSAKYIKELQKKRRTQRVHMQLIHVQPRYKESKMNLYMY